MERLGRNVTVYPDAEELIHGGCSKSGWPSGWPRSAATPRSTPCGRSCSKSNCCPISLKASPSPRAPAGRSWPTTWAWARRSRASAPRRSSPARPASARSWSFAPPRSSRNGGTKSSASATAACNSCRAGPPSVREAYENDAFFTVCNYEQVLRDILAVERARWDLIILDEGQRIKNWESKTARVIKGLKSPFALVLSGTPLENRLDELHSVMQFVDDRRLPPAFRFFHRHRVVNEKGKVLGYKNLDQLRERLRGILLRRTRDSVLQQLPPRTTELVRIPATEEQNALHAAHMQIVQMITRKTFISEMDLLRLQKALLDVPHDGQQHVPGRQEEARLFQQARVPGGTAGRPVRRGQPQGPHVLRVDDDVGPDRAAPEGPQAGLRAAGRPGAAEGPAGPGEPLPRRPDLPAVHHHQRRFDGLEPAGGQHGDQRRSALEPGRAGAADRPGPSHGPAAAGAGLRAGDRGDDRGEPLEHAFRQAQTWRWPRSIPIPTSRRSI